MGGNTHSHLPTAKHSLHEYILNLTRELGTREPRPQTSVSRSVSLSLVHKGQTAPGFPLSGALSSEKRPDGTALCQSTASYGPQLDALTI